MGNSICERFKHDVVCPAKLRSDVFMTAAVDNIAPPRLMVLQSPFSNTRVKTVLVT